MGFLATCLSCLVIYNLYFFFIWWKILWNAHFYLIDWRLECGLFSFSHLYVPFRVVQQMWFSFFKMRDPNLNFFIRGGGINQSVASMWYTFVVKTNSDSSYVVFEQTQMRLIFKGSFCLFYRNISKKFQGNFFFLFFYNSRK